MRSVLTILMVLFALSASAQINNSQEIVAPQDSVVVVAAPQAEAPQANAQQAAATEVVAPQDSVAVVAAPVVAPDSTAVEAAKPEVIAADSLKSGNAEANAPQVATRPTVEIHTHGDAKTIVNNTLYNGAKKVKGFRILIYSGSSPSARGEASSARTRFSKLFNSLPTYMFYENPYFKVSVGNFRTVEEAQAKLERIRKYFPKAFIVHQTISVYEFAK